MTAPHPVAYRSPDRTAVCGAGVGTLSAHKMTTGRVTHQQISPLKGHPLEAPVQAQTRSPTPIVHRGSPIRGPRCKHKLGLSPRSSIGAMTLRNLARCLVHRAPRVLFSGGCAAKPRASHPSGSRRRAGRRWRMCPGYLVPQKTFGAMSRPIGSITDHLAPGAAGSNPWWLTTWARPSKHLAVSGRWRFSTASNQFWWF